jgi:hypothetical protein
MRRNLFTTAFWGLVLAVAPCAYAGVGLVTRVDVATNTLTLETQSGSQQVVVASTAAIRDDHDGTLALRDINPGDAVAYQGDSGPATSVHVARQFWAIPEAP